MFVAYFIDIHSARGGRGRGDVHFLQFSIANLCNGIPSCCCVPFRVGVQCLLREVNRIDAGKVSITVSLFSSSLRVTVTLCKLQFI